MESRKGRKRRGGWEGRKKGTSGLEGTKEEVREEGKRRGLALKILHTAMQFMQNSCE